LIYLFLSLSPKETEETQPILTSTSPSSLQSDYTSNEAGITNTTETTAGITELTGDTSAKETIESAFPSNTTATDFPSETVPTLTQTEQSVSDEIAQKSDSSFVSEPVKSDKQWNHQIRDQSFREFIKDERPRLGAGSQKRGMTSENIYF